MGNGSTAQDDDRAASLRRAPIRRCTKKTNRERIARQADPLADMDPAVRASGTDAIRRWVGPLVGIDVRHASCTGEGDGAQAEGRAS
jgi:hypothetical protein